ncbi:MAG: hypothetical protein ACK4VV_08950 [Pseudomonas sp.]
MRADEFIKKYGLDKDDERGDHSLRGKSLERALHPDRPRSGTPHDWEDWEKFQASGAKKFKAQPHSNKTLDD